MSAAEALKAAYASGVQIGIDGNDLVLAAPAAPPVAVLDLLSRHKAEILALLASRPHQAPQRPGNASGIGTLPSERWGPNSPAEYLDGLRRAALQRPPSWWADANGRPSEDTWCSCCKGSCWWTPSAPDPAMPGKRAWVCGVCHPSAGGTVWAVAR